MLVCSMEEGSEKYMAEERVSADNVDIANVIAEISSYPRFYPLGVSPVGATEFRESITRAVRVRIAVAEARPGRGIANRIKSD